MINLAPESVDYWRRKWQSTPVSVPGKSTDEETWWATVHGVAKSQTLLSDFTSLLRAVLMLLCYIRKLWV